MNLNNESIVRRVRDGQRGQVLVMVPVLLVALLAAAALVIDMGNLYYSYSQLQAATQAAALAGAQALPSSSAAISQAQIYSATGNLNAHPNLQNVTEAATTSCLTTLVTQGLTCGLGPNAIVVTETATVRTFFAKVFGVSSLPIKATATASAKGGFNGPYNVMLVLDTTASMNGSDNSCSIKNATRIQCAVAGVQVLLRTLSPCAGGLSSCGAVSGGNVPNPVDEVGMEVFPPLKDATQSQYDYDCSSKQPTIASSYGQTSPQPVYQIISYSSDYRTSDTAAALNPTSNLAKAVGQGSSPCQPMDAVGGIGTFYADAIDNAQANFPSTTERPNTTNVIIFLGDGDANATKSNMPAGEYPNQCHEAISAAQAAANAGTWVYTIAYGASTSAAGSCSTDSPPTGTAAISACATLQNMASSPGHIPDASKFFSDTVGGTSSCTSAAHSITDLDTIFKTIAGDLTVARLIPNGTT